MKIFYSPNQSIGKKKQHNEEFFLLQELKSVEILNPRNGYLTMKESFTEVESVDAYVISAHNGFITKAQFFELIHCLCNKIPIYRLFNTGVQLLLKKFDNKIIRFDTSDYTKYGRLA